MVRLTDNDFKFGPLTIGRTSGWRPWRLAWSSGAADHGGETRNHLTAYALGWVARIYLPNILRPYRIKHIADSWDAATVARMGRNYYFEEYPREYGFSLCDGHFQIFHGAQTHDSSTTQSWGTFLPWTQWNFIRFSLYRPDGAHFWTELERDRKKGFDYFEEQRKAKEACPSEQFSFYDYDGQLIEATCQIHEREWHFGTGHFKWLKYFRKPMIRRDLDLQFSKEVGPCKGSWKGGTIGHSTEIAPGETCEQAFRRYCDQQHRSRGKDYKITFVGRAAS